MFTTRQLSDGGDSWASLGLVWARLAAPIEPEPIRAVSERPPARLQQRLQVPTAPRPQRQSWRLSRLDRLCSCRNSSWKSFAGRTLDVREA